MHRNVLEIDKYVFWSDTDTGMCSRVKGKEPALSETKAAVNSSVNLGPRRAVIYVHTNRGLGEAQILLRQENIFFRVA